jgi:hypothetical protein
MAPRRHNTTIELFSPFKPINRLDIEFRVLPPPIWLPNLLLSGLWLSDILIFLRNPISPA